MFAFSLTGSSMVPFQISDFSVETGASKELFLCVKETGTENGDHNAELTMSNQ
jgi:hypothetical protein